MLSVVIVAAGVGLAGEARAQPSPPASNESSSADEKEQARLHFTAGVNLLQDPENPRYEEAFVEFKQAYALAKAPSILGNIGLCAMKLERDAEALEAYTRYLAEAPSLDAAERAQTERDIVTLRAGLARITVESRPDGAILHDTRLNARGGAVVNIYGPLQAKTELGIRRGHHVFKARFPDGRETAWELDVSGGETHVFDEPPSARPVVEQPTSRTVTSRPIPGSVWAGVAATAAVTAGAIVVGAFALNARSRYDAVNDGTQRARADGLRQDAVTLNVVSDVLVGAAIVGGLVTAYLYVTRPAISRTDPTSWTARSFRF